MTKLASLVVVGKVASVEPGRIFNEEDLDKGGAVRYVLAMLNVKDVLAGTGSQQGASIKLELGPVELDRGIPADYDELVGHEALFFLRLKGEGSKEFGIAEEPAEAALGFYRVVNSQGLLLNDGGEIEPVWAPGQGFPRNLEGDSFEEVVQKVEAAAVK